MATRAGVVRSLECVRRVRMSPRIGSRQLSGSSPGMPTTLSRLDGFTIRGNKIFGSVALLPRGVFHWKVESATDITPECLTLFCVAEPKPELIVVGTGAHLCSALPVVRQLLSSRGISLEVQDTPNACATFNFLLGEGRLVGAALIPPETLHR